MSAAMLANLRARIAPICQRTLRKQVIEYVRYTKRIPITQDFTPSNEEQRLYDQVSQYLQRDNLLALPNSQRQLIELVLRKILASSSFAIAATLGTMIDRLRKLERTAAREAEETLAAVVGDDYEQAESVEEEWPADIHRFRPGHPLAERLIAQAKARTLPPRELLLDYERRGARISLVERLRGQSGWLCADQLTVTSLDTEQTMLLAGVTDDGDVLDRETCEKLLTVPARLGDSVELDGSVRERLDEALRCQVQRILGDAQKRNEVFFDAESDKLDRWADDLKENLEREIKNLEVEIREAKKAKRLAQDLESKIAAQKRINELEQQRNHRKRMLFDAQDDIEQKKDTLIAEVESRLRQETSRETLFTVRWRI